MAMPLPSTTLTPGLEFRDHFYTDRSKVFDHNAERARAILETKLSALNGLEALIQLTFGDVTQSKAPIFIDARCGAASIYDAAPPATEPDVEITIKPEYIIQFSEGVLDPRLGMFKDALFHETSMPKGDIPKAVRFADLLTPDPPVAPKHADAFIGQELPKPTSDISQVKRDIQKFGYGFVENALSQEEVRILKKAVQEQAAGERKDGVATFDGGPHAPNQRIWNIINRGDEFIDLLNHPLIDEVIPWYLGDHPIISSYSANIARPGNVPMQLHTDQMAITPPRRDIAFGMNIMFYLEDTTDVNGATRVYPASHLGNVAPSDIFTVDGSVAAEAPAGTALVFESRLWHATGPNRKETGERPVILIFFMRSFVRPQENVYLSLRKEVEAKLPDRQKAFLGFRSAPGIGGQDGNTLEGHYVSRKEDAIGRLRAPHEE
ncbi:hypothetical protein BKA67DRAFT_526154 [Truncatella angustata]|uniref:Dioxygenase n=1 Tax=Truncatella angustata TaxID=152316 RepID=A0A9P8U948_9PEZI|nr:uncharacterized protein BKA67DRAFT_526154 [Truncatella angustata]KAH6645904.1 hypothetical protein BKA67DRAFT_526154 [Truncatella angustata]KAH8205288.1 hypothetical protein TruAng_000535 [Truncatella angustata]